MMEILHLSNENNKSTWGYLGVFFLGGGGVS